MTYFEIKTLKELINNYVKDTVEYDKKDIMYRLDKDIIEKLAIVVSRNLEDGKVFENIIKNRLYNKTILMIKDLKKKDIGFSQFVKVKDLEKIINLIFLNENK